MSILNSIRLKLGLSNTPANNFTLTAESDNGTMKLARGNPGATTQDILTVGTDGVVTAPQGLVTNRLVLGTAQNTTSGTAIDFTGIPSWVKRVTVNFNGVSTNGTSHITILLGTSAGIQTTGYLGSFGYVGAGTAMYIQNTGFGQFNDTASDVRYGSLIFTLVDSGTGTWACSGNTSWSTRAYTLPTSGVKTLSGALDRIRISTLNGTDTFDAGQINILYEG